MHLNMEIIFVEQMYLSIKHKSQLFIFLHVLFTVVQVIIGLVDYRI